MRVRKAHTFISHAVHVGSGYFGCAIAAKVTISHVVGHNEDDIWVIIVSFVGNLLIVIHVSVLSKSGRRQDGKMAKEDISHFAVFPFCRFAVYRHFYLLISSCV